MTMLEPGTFIAMLERLWSRSSLLLWAIAAACGLAFLALLIAARVDPVTFVAAAQATMVWLLPLGVGAAVLAGFRTYHERTHPAVRFVADEQQSFVHVAPQSDGGVVTQISTHFEVVNLSDRQILLRRFRSVDPAQAAR